MFILSYEYKEDVLVGPKLEPATKPLFFYVPRDEFTKLDQEIMINKPETYTENTLEIAIKSLAASYLDAKLAADLKNILIEALAGYIYFPLNTSKTATEPITDASRS